MNFSIVFQVAVPTFILLVIGIGLTIYEHHKDTKYFENKASQKRKVS